MSADDALQAKIQRFAMAQFVQPELGSILAALFSDDDAARARTQDRLLAQMRSDDWDDALRV